jgi:hypothetical protein
VGLCPRTRLRIFGVKALARLPAHARFSKGFTSGGCLVHDVQVRASASLGKSGSSRYALNTRD